MGGERRKEQVEEKETTTRRAWRGSQSEETKKLEKRDRRMRGWFQKTARPYVRTYDVKITNAPTPG